MDFPFIADNGDVITEELYSEIKEDIFNAFDFNSSKALARHVVEVALPIYIVKFGDTQTLYNELKKGYVNAE